MKKLFVFLWIFIHAASSFVLFGDENPGQAGTAVSLPAQEQTEKINEAQKAEQTKVQTHQSVSISPEEALETNEEALSAHNNGNNRSLTGDIVLAILSILCIAALLFAIPFGKLKHIRFLHVWDFLGWGIVSFVVMYCVVLIFQINRPGIELLTSLQPILTSSSLHLFLVALLLFIIVFVELILPYLLKCKLYKLFIVELVFSILVGGLVIHHFSIALVSDFETLATAAAKWQTLPQDQIEKLIQSWILYQRCYFSYYMLYKIFGNNYIVIELSQLFMHLALGINVYFLAKQCTCHEKIARLSMILYYLLPVQYLYLTIPSLDLWGGMLLCFNANLILYLFRKCPELYFYKRTVSVGCIPDSQKESCSFYRKLHCHYLSLAAFFRRIPWLLPLLVSILFGVSLFWMEMVRNLQLIFCIPMFLFLSAVLVRRILVRKLKLFSRTMLFLCVLCLFVPLLSNLLMQKICNVTTYGSEGVPFAATVYNSPDEIREVIRHADFKMIPDGRKKDYLLDAATTYWKLYPSDYSQFFGRKINFFSDLFNPAFVATSHNIEKYPNEFTVYSFLVWIMKSIFMPLLLIGILCVLFFKRWNSLTFVPIVLFFFFFILMPTVGECQVRYTSLYYGPMCVCASCTLLIKSKAHAVFRKKNVQTQFVNSILWGTTILVCLFIAVTSLFSSSSFLEEHQLINFHENQRQISSDAYKEYTDRNYLLSSIFRPVVSGVIPEETFFEWTIPEHTTEGQEYYLYGYLISPLKENADLVVKINGATVWDNNAVAKNGYIYSNTRFKIDKEKIVFLDNLKFTAEKENILRVEIVPHNNNSVSFALSAWGLLPCN